MNTPVTTLRNRHIFLGDVLLFAVAVWAAFALRFGWRFYEFRVEFLPYLAAAIVTRTAIFHAFGLYRRVWRYAGVPELISLIAATVASSLALTLGVAIVLFVAQEVQFSRAVIITDALLAMVLAGGLRMSVRVLAESMQRTGARGSTGRSQRRVLIAGAGHAGVMVLRELQRNPQLGLKAVGFVDDDPWKQGKRILGVNVLADLASLDKVIRQQHAQEVLIALPTAGGAVIRQIADGCRQAGVESRTIPGVFEVIDGKVGITRLRQIEIADLLRREPVSGTGPSPQYLAGRTVLITGAGGSIGSELCRQVAAQRPAHLVLVGHGENSLFEAQISLRQLVPDVPVSVVVADVRDRARLHEQFAHWRPSVVFHAAAHKHVPLMEDNPQEALSNNVLGTMNVLDAALAAGVQRLVMISTDKAVAPTNVMGASKRLAEMVVQDVARRTSANFVVVRFGNVLGSRGSVVPVFSDQIERGGPVTVTHPDVRRYFMTIPEACHLVLQAGGMGRGGELFVLDMGEPVRIVDLARDMIALSGYRPDDVPIAFVGLRAGEKLDERLWEEGAVVEPSACPGVMHVREPAADVALSRAELIRGVTAAIEAGSRLAIEAELARWIPSYVPTSAAAMSVKIDEPRTPHS